MAVDRETDPVKVERAVGELIERKEWTDLSHRIIFHGRRVCHAHRYVRGVGHLAKDCPSYGDGPVDKLAAAALVKGPRPRISRWQGSVTRLPNDEHGRTARHSSTEHTGLAGRDDADPHVATVALPTPRPDGRSCSSSSWSRWWWPSGRAVTTTG